MPAYGIYAATAAFMVVTLLALGGYFAWQKFAPSGGPISGTPFATQTVNDLTVTLIHPKGQLVFAQNDFLIEFRDANGELVDMGTVRFALDMNMPGMVMHNAATVKPTGTPGQYRASIKPDMAGDWMVKLEYDGPRGKGEVSFTVNVAASASAAAAAASSFARRPGCAAMLIASGIAVLPDRVAAVIYAYETGLLTPGRP